MSRVTYQPLTRTVGVAVPIPAPYGPELQDWRRSFGDPQADAIPAHITLVPPVPVDEDERDALVTHLEKVAATFTPFRVHLRGTATFMPVSPVVFVALTEGISACERLAGAALRGAPGVESSFPYHPHVTVAHHLPEADMERAFDTLTGYDAVFEVASFSLYEHGDDGYWRPASDFRLAG